MLRFAANRKRSIDKYVHSRESQVADESRDVHVLLLIKYLNSILLFDFPIANGLYFPSRKYKAVVHMLDMVNLMHSHGVFHHHLAGRKISIKDFQRDLQLRLVNSSMRILSLETPNVQ